MKVRTLIPAPADGRSDRRLAPLTTLCHTPGMGYNVMWLWGEGLGIDDLVTAGLARTTGPTDVDTAMQEYALAAADTATGVLIFDPEYTAAGDFARLDHLAHRWVHLVVGDTGHTYRLTLRENGTDRVIGEDEQGPTADTDPSLIEQADPDGALADEFWAERFAGYFAALTSADPMSADLLDPESMQALDWLGEPGGDSPTGAEPDIRQSEEPVARRGFFSRLFGRQ